MEVKLESMDPDFFRRENTFKLSQKGQSFAYNLKLLLIKNIRVLDCSENHVSLKLFFKKKRDALLGLGSKHTQKALADYQVARST